MSLDVAQTYGRRSPACAHSAKIVADHREFLNLTCFDIKLYRAKD